MTMKLRGAIAPNPAHGVIIWFLRSVRVALHVRISGGLWGQALLSSSAPPMVVEEVTLSK